jgi:protein-disulfide isomerase
VLTRRNRLFMMLAPAAALAAAIIVVSATRGGSATVGKRVKPTAVASMLAGIPQSGLVLGRASAPVTLVEFADLQCPFCGEWERGTFPTIVRKYVRTGKVKIEFRGLHFIGSDSETALRAALAARSQDKLWNVVVNLYERQGTENTGWVTNDLLKQVGDSIPGLDTNRMLAETSSPSVDATIKQTDSLARQIGVDSTPSFFAGRSDGKLSAVKLTSLSPAGIEPTLDKLLAE